VTTPTQVPNLQDDRWGDYVPWFFRQTELLATGNLELFFQRLSQRLKRFFEYNEAGLTNIDHFGAYLESESLQRFRFNPKIVRFDQIAQFFDPGLIRGEAFNLCLQDPEAIKAKQLETALRLNIRGVLDIHDQRRRFKAESGPLDAAKALDDKDNPNEWRITLERLLTNE